MKSAITLLGLLLSLTVQADTIRLDGGVFKPATNIQITWAATNSFPHSLLVYKVLTESFSMLAVSNAMSLGQFEMKNLSKGEHPIIKDKNLIYFYGTNEYGRRKTLYIAPTFGAMEYESEMDFKKIVENVPTSDEAISLGRNVLRKLGIDSSMLSDKVKIGYDDTSTKIDREGNKLGGTHVIRRGVAFSRSIGGIATSDSRCFLIHFGSNGRIEDFSLTWRNFVPHESYSVLTINQIIDSIKAGKAVIPEQFSDADSFNTATNLTIVKATPRYYNGTKGSKVPFVYPYLELEVLTVDNNTAFLHCQILSTNAVAK